MKLFSRATTTATDPLSDEASAAAFWAEHSTDQATVTLDALSGVINARLANGKPWTTLNIRALLHLDNLATPLVDRLIAQYLQNARMPEKWQAEQLARLTGFAAIILKPFSLYLQPLADTLLGEAMITAQSRDLVPNALLRSMYYLRLSAKLDYFQNLIPDGKLWRNLHSLYRMAETANILHQSFTTEGGAITSCLDEWLKAVMMATVNQGSLKPRQVEQVWMWLDALSVHLLPVSKADAKAHQYCVDLNSDKPAMRFDGEAVASDCRYWGSSELLYRLSEQRKELQTNQSAALSGLAAYDLAQRLEQSWTPETAKLSLRTTQRRPATGVCLVTGGLDLALSTLKLASTARESQKVERWAIRDLSDQGAGLEVAAGHPWAKLGTLMLVGTPGELWHLSVLRRAVFQRGIPTGHIGVEWLGDEITLVKLENGGLSNGLRGALFGIHVQKRRSGTANGNAAVQGSLVLSLAAFRQGTVLGLVPVDSNAQFGDYRLDEILVQGEDWVMVRITKTRS